MLFMSKRPSIHIVPHDSGWAVKKSGAGRASIVTATKAEADKVGRVMAKNQQAELVIHGRDGRIQDADSFGRDPLPPRDAKH